MKNFYWVSLLLMFQSMAGQETEAFESKSLSIIQTECNITVDGKNEEAIWSSLEINTDFYEQSPLDDRLASLKTEVKVVSDGKYLYVFAKMFDTNGFVTNTLKRDNFMGSDAFCILLDPVNQKANGYGFGVNSLGAVTEVLISEGGDTDGSWDNRWVVAASQEVGYWTAEMAIPLKTLRFEKDKKEWGVNFARVDPGTNEVHVWSPVPRQFGFTELGYFGQMNWDTAPKTEGINASFIPYVSSNARKEFDPENPWKNKFSAGGDAKIALTQGLNLDLTVNPDFSQVEVDAQQTNLTQFNIFFPERRQFFIENGDVFNGYGQFANQPFYSRRIGLDPSGRSVPILYGLRLTGNVNKQLRVGAFNIHTRGSDDGEVLGQNYSSLTFQQGFGKRSNFKGIFLNRQSFKKDERVASDYGRNLGGELNLIAPNGKVAGQFGYIQSLKDGFDTKNRHLYGRFDYNGQNFRTFLFIQNLGENYFSDMGFNARINNYDPINDKVVRIGYTQIGNMLDYYYYPKESKRVNYHWSGIENFIIVNEGSFLNEWYTRLRHFLFFKNSSQLRFRVNHIYTNLVFPFAITDTPLPAQEYYQWEYNAQFNTDTRKDINLEGFIVYGDFFNGKKLTYRGSLNFRKQPWGNFSLGIEQNDINLPEPYGNVDITLATARVEINFSTSLFWTSFVQYNTQANNFNINTRFQWRYAPMSDLFLVYTDNYLVKDFFGPKDRSLVLKLNYWL